MSSHIQCPRGPNVPRRGKERVDVYLIYDQEHDAVKERQTMVRLADTYVGMKLRVKTELVSADGIIVQRGGERALVRLEAVHWLLADDQPDLSSEFNYYVGDRVYCTPKELRYFWADFVLGFSVANAIRRAFAGINARLEARFPVQDDGSSFFCECCKVTHYRRHYVRLTGDPRMGSTVYKGHRYCAWCWNPYVVSYNKCVKKYPLLGPKLVQI